MLQNENLHSSPTLMVQKVSKTCVCECCPFSNIVIFACLCIHLETSQIVSGMAATSLGFFPLKCETVSPMVKNRGFGGQGFLDGSVVKNLPASVGDPGDVGSVPRSGRSLRRGNSNPLQYSCLGNSMDRGACSYSPWDHKESNVTECTHTHTHTH